MSAVADMAEHIIETNKVALRAIGLDPDAVAERGLIKDTRDLIQSITEECHNAAYNKKDPEALFTACFRGLDRIEQKRFVLMNMLEKLKQHSQPLNPDSEPLTQVVDHFNRIGLTDIQLDAPDDPNAPAPSAPSRGRFVTPPGGGPRRWQQTDSPPPEQPPEDADARRPSWIFSRLMWALRKCAEGLIDASIMVVKVVFGQFMKAIRPNVGFSGPWPTITWTIQTEAFEYETLKAFVEKFRSLQSGETPADVLTT